MDKDGIIAAAAQVRSTIKQAISKVTGETGTQADGVAESVAAEAESAAGDAKDAAPGTARDRMKRPRSPNERRTVNH